MVIQDKNGQEKVYAHVFKKFKHCWAVGIIER